MDQESVIADIEDKARRAGLSIRAVCDRAGVHPTTFSRWKRSERNALPISANLASVTRLYAALRSLEADSRRRVRKAVGA